MSDIKLNDGEIKELSRCLKKGYIYIAKDKDGYCYAYKEKPKKTAGNYWEDEYKSYGLHEDYKFLLWEEEKPFYIGVLFEVVYKGNK